MARPEQLLGHLPVQRQSPPSLLQFFYVALRIDIEVTGDGHLFRLVAPPGKKGLTPSKWYDIRH